MTPKSKPVAFVGRRWPLLLLSQQSNSNGTDFASFVAHQVDRRARCTAALIEALLELQSTWRAR